MIRIAAILLLTRAAFGADDVAAKDARRGPAFLDKASIYQIWMRSFTPEGTLKAAAARLPHIANLGAAIVYLSPIHVQSQVGGFSNPYRIKDYYHIDPEYGTEQDLRDFCAAAHRLGLKVLMDIVYYHTAPDSVMLATPEFYMHKDGQIVLGNWKLPRPDFGNPKLRRYLIDNLLYWVRDGVDGFRCDVSYGVPLDFWEEARAELDKLNPDLIMLAESEAPEELLKAFDVSYAFSHQRTLQRVFRDGEPASRVRAQWEKAPRGARLVRASDNHDQRRAIVEFSDRGARAAAVLNFTLDGIPFLYNGQEIGDTVATDHQSHYPLRWDLDKVAGQAGSGLVGGQTATVAWYHRLFELRAQEAAIYSGEVVWVDNSQPDSVITYERRKGSDRLLVVINASNRKLQGAVDAPGTWAPFLANTGDKLESGRYQLGAFGYIVARHGR
jgi:glycosidase